ncbi:phosphatidate cytidylyltransferase [Subtercola boreus]|uniref:Phosphatidate cytidylyltransferase n=1 Tax=Subtercola boreus TaxID=120213 RepID=A0A3E0WCA8_9MICO|nr:phosphatidate cytidylyltransferase [Subtercola boreus]RFA22331.1 phosphatidate cytidylyltransferase [Subtercola boreus]RFA28193.1 phosphatidate cytidylyltransferase [Subtercola boreus]
MSRAELEDRVRARREQFEEANERITARSGRNLLSAVAIGLVLGGLMFVSLLFVTELFLVFVGLIACIGTLELVGALKRSGRYVPVIPSVISAAGVSIASFYAGASGQWLTLLAGTGLVLVWRLGMLANPAHRADAKQLLRDLAAAVLVQTYVVFLASISILLVAQPDGRWWVLAFMLVVICVDTGAYAAGLNFGKHPMAPRISPKKTWEGFAGALLVALVAGVLLSIFMLHQPWWFGLIFGAVLTLTATFGDLAESLLKRDMGIKDMSTWLPGHGGFLDRLDSMLPSAAAAYVLFIVFS